MASKGTTEAQSAKVVQKKGDKPGAGGNAWSDSDVSRGYKVVGGNANPQSNPQKQNFIKTDKGKPVNEPKY